LLFDNGGKIAWIADDLDSNAKYVGLFYTSDDRPIVESKALWNSGLVTYRAGEQSTEVKVDIAGAKKLYLVVTDGAMATIGIMLIGLNQNSRARKARYT